NGSRGAARSWGRWSRRSRRSRKSACPAWSKSFFSKRAASAKALPPGRCSSTRSGTATISKACPRRRMSSPPWPRAGEGPDESGRSLGCGRGLVEEVLRRAGDDLGVDRLEALRPAFDEAREFRLQRRQLHQDFGMHLDVAPFAQQVEMVEIVHVLAQHPVLRLR